ncbi:uncharacterized protein N7511_000804 [Penicillium nucicola]|uniref:uncharacterized protein n=1 Tax=Penicillium nucicola TaxID=1850975 RepID=UPI00254559DF|nr:uncharacterized protein N7511_000804 [Penicillium nucicola]KAJ5775793.1 hypothetical protein N7511_000804 [Penicillium nucicola]
MASIDLDNIIHYHPPPIPKPPCKQPHLTTSLSHPPSNQPVLIHPLPSRPPCLSHESPQTFHPRRQSPFPAVLSVTCDRDAHLNEFDKELGNLEIAEFGSQETLALCFGSREGTQAEDINGIHRKEPHDEHSGASHSDDRFADDLRVLSDGPATPQDTAASSDSAETDLSSASAPTYPVEADGSVSPNEPCPVQDFSPTERNESQLSVSGCETEVNSVAAGNVLSDQAPSPNPSTPVPAGDEPEPANQWSPETGAESRKSSPLPAPEVHAIQLDPRDLSATRDSHLEVRSDGNDIHSTDCCLDGEAVSSPISPVLQKRKQEVSRSEGKDSPRDLSRSCSVSVVVPVTRPRGIPRTVSTRAGSTRCTRKRKNRAKPAWNIESDDPDDSDYTDGNDSGVGVVARLPRLRKRQRRTAAAKIQPAQTRRESLQRVFSSPAPEEEIADPRPGTSLQDMQTIPIRGFLTRQIVLSRVIYSCTFEEDRQRSCPHGLTKAPVYEESSDKTGHTTPPSNKEPSPRATRFSPDEDKLLIELKEKRSLPWNQIVTHFPGRTKGALQVRYSTKLKDRGIGSLRRGRSRRVTCPPTAAVA